MKEIQIKHEWEVFAREYVRDLKFDRNRAYAIAYGKKEDDPCLSANASRLLKKEVVSKLVQSLLKERFNNVDLVPEEIISRLKMMIRWDISDVVDISDGKIKIRDLKELTKDQRYLITKIQDVQNGVSVHFMDRSKAFELLGKYFRLFAEKIEHTGTVHHAPELDLGKLTSDELREYRRIIEKAKIS